MAVLFSLFDPLFCPEDPFIEEEEEALNDEKTQLFSSDASSDSAELLSSLIAGERKAPSFDLPASNPEDPYLHSARKEAVQWIKTVSPRFGFSALTAILAVDYLDRCFLCSGARLRLQPDKPWMKQLSVVACLALAAKVEETRVPFLLDLQLPPASADEVTGFVFETKTIRRMELLVLSTLNWRMNPVTALSFIQCVLQSLNAEFRDNAVEILRICESTLLAVLSDWRWVRFPPSTWAAAAMLHAVGQHYGETQRRILELLQVSKERVEECHDLILELVGDNARVNHKRKSCYSEPLSPSGVTGTCFSYESSSSIDSWGAWPSSVSPPLKRPNYSII